jgi:5-methyltetrahydrofolate--homocysteine methyltransferase
VIGWRAALAERRPLLLDGGLGTMLMARGLGRGQPPEQWLLDRPADVQAVHRAYVEAGTDAVHTNTFGANPIRLRTFGLAERCEELNRRAVDLAREARPAFVIGDVGPTGEYLPPVGQANPDGWHAAFHAQGLALAAAGVDALHVETMSDLREATTALRALRAAAPDLPIAVSLTFERKRRGFFTVMGNAIGDALPALGQAGADAVGANCSITSSDMRDLVAAALAGLAQAGLDLPLLIQPNAGQPRMDGDRPTYDQAPQDFATQMAAIAELRVGAMGGCCGTDPRFIAALCDRLGRAKV